MKQKTFKQALIDLEPATIRLTNNAPFSFPFPKLDRQEMKRLYETNAVFEHYLFIRKPEAEKVNITGVFYSIKRGGRNYFWSSEIDFSVSITPTGMKGDLRRIPTTCQKEILQYLGVSPFLREDNYVFSSLWGYLFSKALYRDLFKGAIYSEETFYKALAKKYFRDKTIPWRVLKDWLEKCYSVDVFDLKAFTKNTANSMKAYVKADGEKKSLLKDMLSMAIKEDTVIDFCWSDRRLKEEHQAQILRLTEKELAEKKENPINEFSFDEDGFVFLNTEKDVFLEAKMMSNCLYSCYYEKMLKHNYLAFHYASPETESGVCFGVRYDPVKKVSILDQARHRFNQLITEKEKTTINTFVEKHKEKFTAFFNKFQSEPVASLAVEPAPVFDDLPY